jgi:hypothetical protein
MRNKIIAAIAVLLVATPAHADDPAALAESLFEEARKLANEQNNWSSACPKFAESHRLKPGGGVVLNLAVCYKKTGRTASAYARYKEGLAYAVRDKNDARIKIATDGIAELEPSLSYLTVIVAPANDEPELKIEIDGQPIPRAAWGSKFPVDPGKRVLIASAPGKKPFRGQVAVEDNADQKAIEIPALSLAPKEPPKSDVVRIDHPQKRVVGFVVGGLGIAGLGIGTYLGLRALDAKSRSDDECISGCTNAGADLSRDAVRFGNLSTVSFAVGFIGVGAGAYLLLTSTTTQTASARVPGLSIGRDHAMFSLSGTF